MTRAEILKVLTICTAALLLPAGAMADTGNATPAVETPDADKLGEIVVTAQRRSENSEHVPISITAVSGEALANANITDVGQLVNSVPGLNIEYSVGSALIFVRGIGTTGVGIENDVGVYVDGVYITSQIASLLNLSNVDHVEVLKGPQGTLFGRNAVGGALSVVTKDPSTTPSADISVGYGNFDTTTTNFYGTTGIGSMLSTDLAFYYSDQGDGWGHDLTTEAPNFRARTIEARNKWLFTPTDDIKVTLSADYALIYNQLGVQWQFLPGAYGADGVSTYRGFYNSLGNGASQNNQQQWGTMLRFDQNLGWARGVSISSLRASTDRDFIDQDATPLPIVEAGPTTQNDRSYSEELQLLSSDESAVRWIAGAYALYDKFYTPNFTIDVGTAIHEVVVVDEPTKSYAGFGQATFEVVSDTHVTLGLRYTNDHKAVSGATYVNGARLPPGIPAVTDPARQQETFDKLTYRAVLDHQFTPDILAYVSFDKGFKSGQYNMISYANPAVQPENLDAWQAGVKSEFLNHRLRVDVAGFHYQYSNIQITQATTGGDVLLNAASAKLYGADANIDAVLIRDFKLQASFEWLHGRYTNFPDAPHFVANTSPITGLPLGANFSAPIDASGNTTVHSPTYTAYLAGDYTIPVSMGAMEVNVSLSYNSGYYWDPDNQLKQPSYALLGAFLKWMPSGQKYDVRLWGNNLTNKEYYSYESAFSLGNVASAAPPRTYGVTGTYHF